MKNMKGKFSHLNTEVICSFSHISEARKAKRHICKSREGQGLKMDGRCVYKHKYTITTEDI